MLTQVNPIKEAEDRLWKEKSIMSNFGFSYQEVQHMTIPVMSYLFKVLSKREQDRKFREMIMRNNK